MDQALQRDFYVDAKAVYKADQFDQDLEDNLDKMAEESEADEKAWQEELDRAAFGDTEEARQRYQIAITPSEFTEFAIRIPVEGELRQFDFSQRRYLRPIYDSPANRLLLMCARQTEKSTFLGNSNLAYCGINYGFKSLFVSATAQQAQVFSVDRVKEPIEISPDLSFMIDPSLNQNVFFKQFRNRSQLRIRYAFLSADRVRGIPADRISIDELQDIMVDNIPIIEQCASHSPWKLFCYSGTPKSYDNTIEVYWSNYSTQNEWMVPCTHHGKQDKPASWWWNVLGMKNIGKDGLICSKCGRSISSLHPMAQWAARQPRTEDNAKRVTFEGFRITQLMVPWIKWHDDIIATQERYGAARYHNEVLGLSYDSGQRPITRAQIKSVCKDTIRFGDVEKNAARCMGGVFAGLDHGTGEQSYELLSLGGYIDSIFQIFFVHRFTGEDLEPRRQMARVTQLLSAVKFTLMGSDYGGGFEKNDFYQRNFGVLKVAKYMYSYPNYKIKWNPSKGIFVVHRTEIMSDVFNAIKQKKIALPNWEEFSTPYAEDILNIFSEYNETTNMTMYKHSPGKADDTFHSILYCLLASMLVQPRPDIIIPIRAGSVSFDRQ